MRILARKQMFQKSKSQSFFKCSSFEIFQHSLGHEFLMLIITAQETKPDFHKVNFQVLYKRFIIIIICNKDLHVSDLGMGEYVKITF